MADQQQTGEAVLKSLITDAYNDTQTGATGQALDPLVITGIASAILEIIKNAKDVFCASSMIKSAHAVTYGQALKAVRYGGYEGTPKETRAFAHAIVARGAAAKDDDVAAVLREADLVPQPRVSTGPWPMVVLAALLVGAGAVSASASTAATPWPLTPTRASAWPTVELEKLAPAPSSASAPTPYSEVVRVLGLLPRPEVGFVDFGCGAEARWCIAAAERWGCRVTGVEIDHARASAARRRVAEAGLAHLVTVIEGDAVTTDVQADVGVAYLYPDVLERLRSKLAKLRAFASYMHQPPGLPATKNGDSWVYAQQPQQPQAARAVAVWNGQAYTHPVCNNPLCGMCASIRAQLQAAAPARAVKTITVAAAPAAPRGHYETRVQCNGRRCQRVNVWVSDN